MNIIIELICIKSCCLFSKFLCLIFISIWKDINCYKNNKKLIYWKNYLKFLNILDPDNLDKKLSFLNSFVCHILFYPNNIICMHLIFIPELFFWTILRWRYDFKIIILQLIFKFLYFLLSQFCKLFTIKKIPRRSWIPSFSIKIWSLL